MQKIIYCLVIFVAVSCGGGSTSNDNNQTELVQPTPTLLSYSISNKFLEVGEIVSISYGCTNMPSGLPSSFNEWFVDGEIANMITFGSNGFTVLKGHAPTMGWSGGPPMNSIYVAYDDHFESEYSLMAPSSASVNFSPRINANGSYQVKGSCVNAEGSSTTSMTFTVLPGNYDRELFDNVEIQ